MDNSLLKKYARLIIKTGINLQKGQLLVINTPVECAPITRIIAETAYEEGARDVVLKWTDEKFSKIRYMHAPEEIFEEVPNWEKEFYTNYAIEDAAFLSIHASDPEIMKDVNPDRIAKEQKAKNKALSEYRDRLMSNKNVWCVISIPTPSWAKKVFPDVSENEAVEKLWDAIFKAVRVNADDPVKAWDNHKMNLKKYKEFLNNCAFKYLRYKNSLGTDVQIELPDNHIWLGGEDYTEGGREFVANIPTEEVFTIPSKTGINGTIVSTMPLNYNGNIIDKFSLTFNNGKIVDFKAEKGYEVLQKLIETDEGSHYLGEVSLVPYNSPISNLGILFYNTLFDENASCHFAIGKGYPVCLKNSNNMSKEDLKKAGANDSLVHVDFMAGSKDLQIMGITKDGKEVPVFKDGNFAF